ncbi:MAG: hypothetical protein J6T24_05840 [Clostridia bacterium]|nr:hypothetical protein [Clostridia bacterium]MBO7762299.1 hypothetical protein [Clostridia bacterium]
MKSRPVKAAENPLYEKLYNRFSYSGKTVGEMMLSRARTTGAAKVKDSHLRDITAETCITRANLLPRADGMTAAPQTCVRRPGAVRRTNPCALLGVLLLVFIFGYLLLSGIRHYTGTSPAVFPVFPSADVALYEPTVDTSMHL